MAQGRSAPVGSDAWPVPDLDRKRLLNEALVRLDAAQSALASGLLDQDPSALPGVVPAVVLLLHHAERYVRAAA